MVEASAGCPGPPCDQRNTPASPLRRHPRPCPRGPARVHAGHGGHLLSFARIDEARPASGYPALTKAVSAATFRQETGTLPPKGEPDLLLNSSLQNAASAASESGRCEDLTPLTLQRYFERTVDPFLRRVGFFGLGFLRARTIGVRFFFDSRAARLRHW